MVLSPAPCPSASSLSLLLLWRLLCLVRLLQALSLPPEQEAREHGVLLLLGGQEMWSCEGLVVGKERGECVVAFVSCCFFQRESNIFPVDTPLPRIRDARYSFEKSVYTPVLLAAMDLQT
jgi:hypothetical protein